MNLAAVDRIADAVLYEGYMLYPYRPSLKNRQRWTFGGLCPRTYSEAQAGAEPWYTQTECLVAGDHGTALEARVRFLHLVDRTAGALAQPVALWREGVEPAFQPVAALQVGGRLLQSWQEAVERSVALAECTLGELAAGARRVPFAFPARRDVEPVPDPAGKVAAVVVRQQERVEGAVEWRAAPAGDGLFRVTVRVGNETPLADVRQSRDQALTYGFAAAHTVLGVHGGEFVSLTDPPPRWRDAAAACHNVGAWPVLVGSEGDKSLLLSAPIILSDYPQIAPESPGDLFDATEIDEILTLRILTLTDEEKRQVAAVDGRTRALLERTEALAREQRMALHGTVRDLRPVPQDVRPSGP